MNYEKNLKTMARASKVTLDEMLHSRSYPLPQLRSLMMADCFLMGITRRELAKIFDKDRATVYHCLREASNMREYPSQFKKVFGVYADYQQKLIQDDMTKEECIEVLERYNDWRRYDGEIGKGPEMIEPRVISIAIDKAIEYLKETL